MLQVLYFNTFCSLTVICHFYILLTEAGVMSTLPGSRLIHYSAFSAAKAM